MLLCIVFVPFQSLRSWFIVSLTKYIFTAMILHCNLHEEQFYWQSEKIRRIRALLAFGFLEKEPLSSLIMFKNRGEKKVNIRLKPVVYNRRVRLRTQPTAFYRRVTARDRSQSRGRPSSSHCDQSPD